MDLRVAGIAKAAPALVSTPDGGGVRALGVGGEIEDVAVPSGGEKHGVGKAGKTGLPVTRSRVTMPRALPSMTTMRSSISVRGNIVTVPVLDLAFERLVSAEQKLLSGLAAGVESARDLRAAEGAVGERSAIFARERHALGDALVDDVDADLRQAVDVGFASAEVAALHGVVEEAVDAVAVVLIVLGGVDAALRGDAVGPPGTVLKAEALGRCSPARPERRQRKRPRARSRPR
jgi:hypothetical protein